MNKKNEKLIKDKYGNYVIKNVIENGKNEEKKKIIL